MVENGQSTCRRIVGKMDIQAFLNKLPSVEKVLEDDRISSHISPLSRNGVVRIVRDSIEVYRKKLIGGKGRVGEAEAVLEEIVGDLCERLRSLSNLAQKRVINATGVILHTNLGRAPLGADTRASIESAGSGYTDLEFDLESGKRTSRGRRVGVLLPLLTGAQDALVVNNNAAAILLAVNTFAAGGAVAVSRGELVEIGGSFRLPEILALAAGSVIEIGTTNRTHLKDYEDAVDSGATLLLKVHTSNYRVVGYTNEVGLRELSDLGRRRGVPVMYDQGSGILYPFEMEGLEGEQSIGEVMQSGVDMISFSADKVLGGPQGGVIIGRSDLVEKMRKNHLSRALRIDKLTLAGLERVLQDYWRGDYEGIPAWKMMMDNIDGINSRARKLAEALGKSAGGKIEIVVVDGESSIGGGSFPINPLPTRLVRIILPSGRAARLAAALRMSDPAVIVRTKGDSVFIDPRTVAAGEEKMLLAVFKKGFGIVREGSDPNGR